MLKLIIRDIENNYKNLLCCFLFDNSIKIPIFTLLEQGKFLSEKHRNEAGAEVGAFLGGLL